MQRLLLSQLCAVYHGLMQLLQLQPSPLTETASTALSRPAVQLSASHLAFLTACAHNLSLLASQLPAQPHAVFLSHYAIALMTLHTAADSAPASSSSLPHSFLFHLSLLDEQAGRSRDAAQAVYAQAMLRVLDEMRRRQLMRGEETEGQQRSAGDAVTVEETLQLQALMYAVAAKRRYVITQQQAGVGVGVAEETFELEQRLSRLMLSRGWPESMCQQLLNAALRLRFPSLALPLLQRLLSFASPSPHRAQLFCALASDSQLCIHCSSLLSAAASHAPSPVSFGALRCLAHDCHARGVKAARLLRWEEAERLMSTALQTLRHCSEQDSAGGAGRQLRMDSRLTAEMQQQLELVQRRRAADSRSSSASLLSV